MQRGLVEEVVVEVTPGWWPDPAEAQRVWAKIEAAGFAGAVHHTGEDGGDKGSMRFGPGMQYNLTRLAEVTLRWARPQAHVWLTRRDVAEPSSLYYSGPSTAAMHFLVPPKSRTKRSGSSG